MAKRSFVPEGCIVVKAELRVCSYQCAVLCLRKRVHLQLREHCESTAKHSR